MRRKVAAGNWKLHKTIAETKDFFDILKPLLRGESGPEIIVAPVSLALWTASQCAAGSSIRIAAQNCFYENRGAFTGEISPGQIRDAGATHVIIGHSERRAIFLETDDTIRKKTKLALAEKLVPIVCIGETLQEREAGLLRKILERQLTYGLEGINAGAADMMLAYEPVWAIGTGKTATPQDAQEAHDFIRGTIRRMLGNEFADSVRILYGGSVKPDNTASLSAMQDVDGVLVGGASLDANSFIEIINNL